jgi:hypothetical protein
MGLFMIKNENIDLLIIEYNKKTSSELVNFNYNFSSVKI